MKNMTVNVQKRIVDFNVKLDYRLMNDYIDVLAERYPALSVTSIGQSVLGRRIPMLSIGKGNKTVAYIGGQEGNEYRTSRMLLRYVNELCEYAANGGKVYNCSVPYLLETRSIAVIPMLNPDGVEYCLHGTDENNPLYASLEGRLEELHEWQGNARGIVLSENYGGTFDSLATLEPETGSLRNYLMFNRNIRAVVAWRQGSLGVSTSESVKTPPRLHSVGESIAKLILGKLQRGEGKGTLSEFCARELVIPAFDVYSPYSADSFFEGYFRQRSALFLIPTLI